MYFNRKNAEQKNWRMIKKGKHFLFGCSLVFAVGASLATQTVHADTASEFTVESGSKAEEAKPGYGGETGTYEAPAAVAETQSATVEKAVVAENTTAKTANKEALTQLVEEVKGLDKAGKTEDSLSRLNTALEQAQNVLANAEASQDQVDAALASLKEAVAQLAAKEEKATAVATEAKAEATEDKAETAVAETEVARPRGKRDLSSRAANRSVDGSVAEGEFAGAGVKQFQSVRYSVDGDRTTWTISVVPQHKNHQAAGLVVASDDTIQSITVVDRGPNAGRLNEDYYVEKDFGKLPAMSNHKALASHYKYIGGGVPDSLTYSVVTKGTHHNLFARFATAIVKNSLENGGMNGSSAVKNRTSDFPEVGINLSSRLAPQPGVNNTYTQTNDTITVPTIASTDTVLTGTGTPGARINIKVKGETKNNLTVVGQNGQWSFPITIGLNSNVTGGAQLVPGSQISVSQTVGGVESAATPVNVSLGHSEIVPSSKSKQQNNLVENDRNITLKVPHDAGAAYFQFTDTDGKAQEVGLKRDAVPGKWQVNSSSSALASVASSEQGAHYSTINLTLNKDMKAGTTARVISNMQEDSYSSLQGWQSRDVEAAPKEETPAPVTPQPQPQPEPSKPSQPVVDGASETSGPEIVNDLAGKASTPADVTVKAPAGSTVKLYNKDGVVIGEAVANDQGVATVHPTNSLPEGEITATSTPAGGKESAKSTPITVTKTPTPIENKQVTTGPYKLQMMTNATKVTLYRGDKLHLTGDAAGTALRWFGITKATAFNVKGISPTGGLATNGSSAIRNSHAETEGTVSWNQRLGDTTVTFRAEGSPNPTSNQRAAIERTITVTVLETTKKYDPVAGTKVDIANPNNVSEDEKNKIIDSVKTANPNLPAETQYSVDEKGNLTITYPDGSTDKVAAAYLVNPTKDTTAPAAPVVTPTIPATANNMPGAGVSSTDKTISGTGTPGATVTIKSGDNTLVENVPVGADGTWTATLPKGLNSNITTQPQLTPKDKVTVTQTLNGVPSEETEVPVALGETTIQPDEKSSDKQSLIEGTKTITVKVPHDAGMAYLGYTNKDTNKAGEVALKRDSIDGPWYAKDELKAVVKSYATDGFTDTIVLEMKEPVKEGKAKAIANIVEGKYSSPVGWKEINVERDTTAPDQPTVETDLTGKAGTKTPVEVTAEPGSTVALYDKDNHKIGEATAGENGKATITPKVDIPAGAVTAKATDAAGNESKPSVAKEATVSDTVRPVLNIPYDDADNQAIYVYSGETNNIELKVTDNSGKIVKAYLAMPADNRQGLGTEDTSYLGGGSRAALYLKADRIKTETEATETNPAVIHVTGEVPANTYTEQNGQFTRYLFAEDAAGNTAYEHVGAPMEKGALGRIRFMWKPQTFKYTATAPTTPLVGDNAPTAAELEQAVKSANPTFSDKIKTVAVNGDKVIVTYNDGSTDELPKDSVFKIRPAAPVVTPTIPATANNMPGAGVSSTDKTISGTGTPGATVTIKSGDNTLVENVPVGADGTWTATLPKGLNSNITTQPQLTPKDKVTVTQTLNGVPSAETEVPVGLGETTIQPDEKSSDKQSLIEGTKTITVKVPHDAGMAYLGYTNKDTNKAGEVALKRDSIDGPWYAKDESKAVVKSYATDGFTDTIVLEMKEPVKEGKAKAIANIVEGKYSSPVGWKEINVEAKQPTDADKNTPTAKEQTVNKGETPDAKKSIDNFDKLPEGTKAEFKTPVDTTTPGDKTPTVVVTYPDGSKDEVPVTVKVVDPSTDADKNTPTAKEQTVNKGETPDAKKSIDNFDKLPEGTKAEFKTPVDTTTPGDKTPTVVVTYPDGSKDEVPVTVKVVDPSTPEKPTEADKNTPTAKEQTVNKGETPDAKKSIDNFDKLPEGTKAEFKTPVDTTTPGDKTPTVVVTYPDGSKDEVPVTVKVVDPSTDADKNTPTAKEQTVNKGETPDAKKSIDNFDKLPEGTKAEFKTPVDTTTPGDKTPTVVVTYPDGSKDEVPVTVKVVDPSTDADKNTPTAKEQAVNKGETPDAKKSIDNFDKLPEGTKAEFKTPVDTTTPGDKTPTVVVTYPDGSKDEVPVTVKVVDPSTDADKNTPTAKEQAVNKGETPDAKKSIGNVDDLPKGTTVEFKTPVDTTTPGDKDATVVVTYPDGSKDEVPVTVKVVDPSTDADKNTPTAKDQTVKPGDKPSAKDSIGNVGDLPEGTTVDFKTPVDTTTPGDKDATVVVTYPDGSKDEVPVKVTVKDPSAPATDADKNTPTAKDQTVKPGDKPSAKDSIGNVDDLPKGTTVEFKTPVDTTTPGDKTPTVVVTYPDGSKDEVPVTVKVVDPSTDADKNTPTAKEQAVNKGETPDAKKSIDNFDKLPEGTKAEFKTPVDTTTPGDKTPTVVVTYPDGSKDEVPVTVKVVDPSTDADKNTPTAKEQAVNKGETPDAKKSIGNVDDLPKGTTVEFKTPVDTTIPGDKTPTVVVTYPDGSKDEVPVTVKVVDPSTDADKNTPTAKEQAVNKGETPDAKKSIDNFDKLPEGTKAEFKTPVDTTTPGDKTPTVVVTYPDGSKDEVPVTVKVVDPSTDADKNTPTAKEQAVNKGETPDAKKSIGNVDDLPKGTTVEFKTPVDTTIPGDKTPTVVVTYPDGSKDEVPVTVKVVDPSTDADKNTPTAKEQAVNKGETPDAKKSIGNVDDLPKGTTVEFKTPVDTTIPGDKTPTVVVTYPDGSKDEVPVTVKVVDPSTDADKNTPTAKDQTVKPGDKPSAKDSIGNVGDLPEGTTVDFKTPVDTTTPGDKDATVVVTYPDGSKDEVPVKVTVKDPSAPATDADKNTPTAKDQTVKPGDKPSAKDSIGNVGDLPKGTTVEFKTPVDTTTPGDKGTTVVVTYPDGSKDEVPVKVTVKDPSAPATDADKNTPTAKDQTVKPGDKPSAKDSIGNVGDLPKGTTVEFKTPVDTTTPGDKGTTVVVTYPDGSKDEVPVKVTVKDPSAPATDADKNTPTAKDQTVKPGDKPSAKDSIGNVGDLPEGTTVDFKTPVDTTTPGDKDATVVVTYPDGSKDEVPVKVTVKDPSAPATDADKNTPTAKDQTVKPGDKPSAKDSIGNVGDLPKGTTVEFKTPVDTTTPGDKGTTVVVTYPDGSKDEVPVKVTVKDPSAPATDADKNTPTAKDQTVKPGDKPSAKDSIGNVGDLPKGTTVEFKTPVDTTTPGDKGTTVVVTYPDGSKDEVPVKVTVKDPSAPATDADKNTPTAKDQTVKPGDKPSAKDSIGNVGDLPKGTTVEFKTPVDTTTPGDKGTTVVVTYPDGSKDEVPVKVTVKDPSAPATDADKNTPTAKDQTVKPGDKPSAKDSIGNVGDLPEGTTVDFKTPVDTTTPGDKDATVVVTYPDGSKDEVPVKVTVKDPSAPATDADKNTPTAKDQTVKPGDKPSAKDSIGNVGDLPKGTTVEFKTPVDTTTPGDKGTTVVVTYPDGSKDEVPVKVTVKDPSAPATDADKNTPTAKDQTVKPGDKPSAKDSIGNVGDLPEGTTVDFKTPVDTTTPGDKDATVVVTYPDGSKDEVPVKVTVKDPSAPATDADKNTPTAKDQTVKPGDKPSAKDSIGNVGDLPKGTTVEFKTPVDTTTPGDKGTTVVVTYPDGSKDEVPVKVTVKDPSAPATDADKNTPTAKDQTVKPGDKPSAKDSIGNVGDLPEGTTVDFKTPVDTTTPGDKDATVVVTYPDGSKDEVPVKVTVKDPSAPATDADKNTPTAKDQTVKPGDKPSAKDSIGNVGDLPKGTTVEFKTPVDTTTPGDKGTTVVVTYPDGSKDEVPVKVTVKDPSAPATDADKNTPTAKDQTVKPGDKPSAKDSIGNVGDLPEGTTVDFKTPVDTTTPGDKDATVVVTYPDGSKDEVPVKVTVKDPSAPATDADKNTPTAKDQTVKPGDKPSAKDSIGNVGDLPEGTTVDFKTPVDTTTPGDKDATVVVTYPDGSKDEVPVKVTVKDPSAPATDADKNTPTAKDQTVKPGDKPSAKDSIGNVGDLPKGTTVEFKTPVDTTTPGDKGTTVVVTYPDGSKDEVPVKVTVKDPSAPATDADKNTPTAKDQTVKPGDKPSAKDSIGNVGDLPKGTTVEFKTPVDTTTPGDKDATVVVTYPDGSKDEVPVKVTVKDPSAPATDAGKNKVTDPTVTPVTDPSNLTDAEKAKVAEEVKKSNPTVTDVKVGKDGTTTVTYPDGTTAVIPADKTVKKSSDKVKESDGVKNPSVTPVTDPSNLTDAEKAKVADEVKKANPTAKDIKVNKDGSVVVTFEDGSVAVIPAEKSVTAANQDSPAQAPAKKAGAKELPNTGTEQSSASLALALLAAATGGLLFAKKREEEE